MNQIHLLLNEIYSRFCYKMVDMALEHQSACKYIEMSALFIINEGFQIWVIVHLSAAVRRPTTPHTEPVWVFTAWG